MSEQSPCDRNGVPISKPTIENWLRPPNVFWAARHARDILPCATIEKSETPRDLPRALRDDLLDQVTFEAHATGKTQTVRAYLESSQSDALVVVKEGKVLVDWRGPRIGENECHLIFSVTKSLTGLLCGALVGKGLIEPTSLASRYVPELAGTAFSDATVRHLLDMEASYDFKEDYSPGPDLVAFYKAAGYLPATPEEAGLHKFLLTRQRDLAEPHHGKRFRYLTPTTDVLSWICEAASGLRFAAALSKYLWVPMGAEAVGVAPIDVEGTSRGSGGFSATPRDMARVGMVIAQDGAGIVPQSFIDDLLHGGSLERWAIGDMAHLLPGGSYRSGWYQPRVDPDCVLAVGIRGQVIYVDRPRRVVIAKQASWDEPDPEDKEKDSENCCQAIARACDKIFASNL